MGDLIYEDETGVELAGSGRAIEVLELGRAHTLPAAAEFRKAIASLESTLGIGLGETGEAGRKAENAVLGWSADPVMGNRAARAVVAGRVARSQGYAMPRAELASYVNVLSAFARLPWARREALLSQAVRELSREGVVHGR